MAVYRVNLITSVTVEAADEDDAWDKALAELATVGFQVSEVEEVVRAEAGVPAVLEVP